MGYYKNTHADMRRQELLGEYHALMSNKFWVEYRAEIARAQLAIEARARTAATTEEMWRQMGGATALASLLSLDAELFARLQKEIEDDEPSDDAVGTEEGDLRAPAGTLWIRPSHPNGNGNARTEDEIRDLHAYKRRDD